jgi:RHS repeat-associated protein
VKYYPYGEQEGAGSANDRDKYGTYYRDATTGLDYAQNRYYASTMGRFLTPDLWPAGANNGAVLTGNWNRYAYVSGDPVNMTDPVGLCSPEDSPLCFDTTVTENGPSDWGPTSSW